MRCKETTFDLVATLGCLDRLQAKAVRHAGPCVFLAETCPRWGVVQFQVDAGPQPAGRRGAQCLQLGGWTRLPRQLRGTNMQSSGGVWTLHFSLIRPKTPLFPSGHRIGQAVPRRFTTRHLF